MEPVPADFPDLFKVIQSGGNVAAVVGIWVLLRIRAAIEIWVKSLTESMTKMTAAADQLTKTTAELSTQVKNVERTLEVVPRGHHDTLRHR